MCINLGRRLRIIESGHGRHCGWYLEHGGERLAVLSDPRRAEQFWDAYRIEPVSEDPQVLVRLGSPCFWNSRDLVFRSRGFPDEVVETAFGGPGPRDNEVTIRGLYLAIDEPFWLRALVYFRSFWKTR